MIRFLKSYNYGLPAKIKFHRGENLISHELEDFGITIPIVFKFTLLRLHAMSGEVDCDMQSLKRLIVSVWKTVS